MDLEADTMVDELFSQVNENEWSRLIKRAKWWNRLLLITTTPCHRRKRFRKPMVTDADIICVGTRKQCTEINWKADGVEYETKEVLEQQ